MPAPPAPELLLPPVSTKSVLKIRGLHPQVTAEVCERLAVSFSPRACYIE
eukprot:gene3509-1436_t